MKRNIYNVSMFFLAPLIGLAYIFLLPIVSTTLFLWYTIVHYLPESAREMIEDVLGPVAINPRLLLQRI